MQQGLMLSECQPNGIRPAGAAPTHSALTATSRLPNFATNLSGCLQTEGRTGVEWFSADSNETASWPNTNSTVQNKVSVQRRASPADQLGAQAALLIFRGARACRN